MLLNLYIIATVLFLAIHILSLEKNILSLESCRSRESKVLLRKSIKRDSKDVLLSLVWPCLVLRAIRTILIHRKELR